MRNTEDFMKTKGQWFESTQGVLYVVDETVQFFDDWDHWRNAFIRLLELPEEKIRAYVEHAVSTADRLHGKLFSELDFEDRVGCLKDAAMTILNGGPWSMPAQPQASWGTDLEGAHADKIYAGSIAGDRSRLVAGNREHEFAWSVDARTFKPVEAGTIVYDTAYFSTGRSAHYGQPDYLAHADWRLEKARRLVRNIMTNAGKLKDKWIDSPDKVKVLDVGSAIGYFRRAFADYGFDHYGTEISQDMIEGCRARFGYETWSGGIATLDSVATGMKFDIITMWDVIEHLDNVADMIAILRDFLSEDGVLVVRTPNLSAVEADVLRDYYYSFKMDHLIFFSPRSLNRLMCDLKLSARYVETDSHMFKGFLGADCLYKLGRAMRGADIFAIYERAR